MNTRTMNSNGSEEVDRKPAKTQSNFNRKSDGLAGARSQPMRKSFEKVPQNQNVVQVNKPTDSMMIIGNEYVQNNNYGKHSPPPSSKSKNMMSKTSYDSYPKQRTLK